MQNHYKNNTFLVFVKPSLYDTLIRLNVLKCTEIYISLCCISFLIKNNKRNCYGMTCMLKYEYARRTLIVTVVGTINCCLRLTLRGKNSLNIIQQ